MPPPAPSQQVESQTLAMFRDITQQLQTTCASLGSSLQGLPAHIKDQALQARQQVEDLQATFSGIHQRPDTEPRAGGQRPRGPGPLGGVCGPEHTHHVAGGPLRPRNRRESPRKEEIGEAGGGLRGLRPSPRGWRVTGAPSLGTHLRKLRLSNLTCPSSSPCLEEVCPEHHIRH